MKKHSPLFLFILLGFCGFGHSRVPPSLIVEAHLQPTVFAPTIPLLGSVSCTVSYRGVNYSRSGTWSNDPANFGKVKLTYELQPVVRAQPAVVNCRGVYMDVMFRPVTVSGLTTTLPGLPAPTILLPIQ